MNYKSDLLSLVTILLNLTLYAVGLILPFGISGIFYILLTSILVFMVFHVNHNHIHNPIFKNEGLNFLINSMMSIAILNPVTLFYFAHLSNHHPNYCNDQDWTGRHHAGHRMGLLRVFRYNISVFLNFLKNGFFISRSKLPISRKKSLVCEILTLSVFISMLLYLVPLATFLLYILLPSFLGLQGMIFMNFFVHDGCLPEIREKSCRNFTSTRANFLTFNNGFHLAHHEWPQLHWSLLPSVHQKKYAQTIEPEYIHSSSLEHFIKYYVIGRKFER